MQFILLALAVALGFGRLSAWACERVKLPPVVGEILAGLVLANIASVVPWFTVGSELGHSAFLREFAEIGIILMLFIIGLESTVTDVLSVGGRAFAVAVVGVVTPFVLTLVGWRFGLVNDILPNGVPSFSVPVFIGATMTATSVGITARVLSEAGALQTRTGRIILNAAVIDDILGLLVLAGVSSFIATNEVSAGSVAMIAARAVLFFLIGVPVGLWLLPRILRRTTNHLVIGLVVCLVYAWFGLQLGLAPIVGAFFAGLLVEDAVGDMRKHVYPIVAFLSPLFFVLIGAQVNLSMLADSGWSVVWEVLIFFILAVVGKFACAAVAGRGANRLAVGIGMIPRGEVGLIFALTGKQIGVLSDRMFGVLVIVVLLSTIIPSIVLGTHLRKSKDASK